MQYKHKAIKVKFKTGKIMVVMDINNTVVLRKEGG